MPLAVKEDAVSAADEAISVELSWCVPVDGGGEPSESACPPDAHLGL